MSNPHQNAGTTALGLAEMIRRILKEGRPVHEVAAGFGVSERTARKWLARFKAEGPSGLENRSSCPKAVANRTGEYWISLIEQLRRDYRLTADEIASKLELTRCTKWRPGSPGEDWTPDGFGAQGAPQRYQHQRPGELIHLDIKMIFQAIPDSQRSSTEDRIRNLRVLRIIKQSGL